jgi:hypothetical protein
VGQHPIQQNVHLAIESTWWTWWKTRIVHWRRTAPSSRPHDRLSYYSVVVIFDPELPELPVSYPGNPSLHLTYFVEVPLVFDLRYVPRYGNRNGFVALEVRECATLSFVAWKQENSVETGKHHHQDLPLNYEVKNLSGVPGRSGFVANDGRECAIVSFVVWKQENSV